MDDFTQDLTQAQATTQGCLLSLAKLQTTIALPNSQLAQETLLDWQQMQSFMGGTLILDLNNLLETIEEQNLDSVLESQLRSLNPEVTRLIKLLQIDWQFWQAARQPDRFQQRQQQLLIHLQQLEQLLGAIDHHLQSKKSI
jgi:hypothetical protein